jgi:NTP pyrophosphatase (non-canonical NTP hydrolase)
MPHILKFKEFGMTIKDENTEKDISLQQRTDLWMNSCFTYTAIMDKVERNHRFLEEALELVQACNCSREDAHALVEYVYNRPVGEIKQEIGGTILTLAALCSAHDIDMMECAETELVNDWKNIDKIRDKQIVKTSVLAEIKDKLSTQELDRVKYSKLHLENESLYALLLKIRKIITGSIHNQDDILELVQSLKNKLDNKLDNNENAITVSTELLTDIARTMKDWWYVVDRYSKEGNRYASNARAFQSAIADGNVPDELAELIRLLKFHKNVEI